MEWPPLRFGHIQRNHYLKFRNTGASADAPVFHFHRKGRDRERHLQRLLPAEAAALREAGSALSVTSGATSPGAGESFPKGGKAFGKTANFTAPPKAPPRGGAVAQRLRGNRSAEPEKTVKRSSRRRGVNLQFFPVEPTALGLSRASSP